MKTSSLFSSALIALFATGLAAECQAFTWGGKLQMVVVAEQADPAAKLATPATDAPAYYVAYDAGYIESGDPIGGLKPPSAAAIAQALSAALASQHYLPAPVNVASAPSLLLVYHWGLINRDTHQIRNPFRLQPNLKARIELVATARYAQRIESDLLDRRQPLPMHVPIIDPTERDLIQLAQDDQYFVIVSAYDYASVARQDARLLWRVKMSDRSPGVAMAEALPTLLQGGAPYFGRDFKTTQFVDQPVVRGGQAAVGAPNAEGLAPPEVTQQLDKNYLNQLLHREHVRFSGEFVSDADAAGDPAPATSANAAGSSFLPPALAARIKAYEQEKSALQDALTARVKEHTPGADTGEAIDAFNRDNADRIAALTSERRAIRDELATLAAANTDAATGKSLQALQQEFAAGVQQLAAESPPASP